MIKEILELFSHSHSGVLSLGKTHLNSGLFSKARANSLNLMSPFSKQGTGRNDPTAQKKCGFKTNIPCRLGTLNCKNVNFTFTINKACIQFTEVVEILS